MGHRSRKAISPLAPLADINRLSDLCWMTWPALSTAHFIAGRSATIDDVDQGSAIFCQQSDDAEPSRPADVDVPQYAIWHEAKGANVRAILVQAEHHITDPEGDALFGLRTLDGREVVANSGEVTLLGRHVPGLC
jgi:hypothetical protein